MKSGGGLAIVRVGIILFVALIPCYALHSPVIAAEFPSLFRGVVVADSPLGVRVVTVDVASQAALADLRPEDLIIRIHGREIRSIDEFAALSGELKGRVVATNLVVFRQGMPRELSVHLYSYPVLRTWGLEFVPDHDVRFAQPDIGLAYWRRLGRGFEEAQRPAEALRAYLNALHNVPNDTATAMHVATLFSQISQQHLREQRLMEGIAALRQAVQIMEHLLAQPLTDEQLLTIQHQLQETLTSLRDLRRTSSTTGDMWRLLQPFTRRSADFSPQNTWSRKI